MTNDELRALADALSGERIAGMLDAEEAHVCEYAAGYLRTQADEKPVAWNQRCGFKAKPIVPLFADPTPATPKEKDNGTQ